MSTDDSGTGVTEPVSRLSAEHGNSSTKPLADLKPGTGAENYRPANRPADLAALVIRRNN